MDGLMDIAYTFHSSMFNALHELHFGPYSVLLFLNILFSFFLAQLWSAKTCPNSTAQSHLWKPRDVVESCPTSLNQPNSFTNASCWLTVIKYCDNIISEENWALYHIICFVWDKGHRKERREKKIPSKWVKRHSSWVLPLPSVTIK